MNKDGGEGSIELQEGDPVWIPDEEHKWSRGQVDSFHGDTVTVIPAGTTETRTLKCLQIAVLDPSHDEDLDNVCLMNNMHEAPLLDLLRRRFFTSKIYTYTSDLLISLNPFDTIDGLYDNPHKYFALEEVDDTYEKEVLGESAVGAPLPPHVYQIANDALKALCNSRRADEPYRDQSIIISGESGAGKTENSKHVLHYLISANSRLTEYAADEAETSFADFLKDVLVKSSIVMEAFGNAKTLRNDNSSRFGKYIKLMYQNSHGAADGKPFPKLLSAQTETFLLEKSRLTSVGKGERSYHIFYQLLAGLDDASIRMDIGLEKGHTAASFRLLSQGECLSTADDAEEYENTMEALRTMSLSEKDEVYMLRLLVIILHLSNLQFAVDEETEKVQLSCPTIAMDFLSNLLGLHEATLSLALTTQTMRVRGRASVRTKILTVDDVANNANALLKWLYSKLFDWLVRKINVCHASRQEAFAGSKSSSVDVSALHFVGILDIFGFEILRTNSFEQLCINYTNERLQQQFNEHIFVREQEMYRAEGLSEWASVSFQDNQPVLDLISSAKKPLGLLQLLEEQGMLNRKPDDLALLTSFNQHHEAKDPKAKTGQVAIYSRSKFGNNAFLVKHFAGEVTYTIDSFLVKNNDSLQEDLMNTLRFTSNDFLREVMGFGEDGSIAGAEATSAATASAPAPAPSGGAGKKMASAASVSLQFRTQLDRLMTTLYSTQPHYIKCVKSNERKEAERFEAGLVLQQLRYSGVLEVVRIRREGFPLRMSFRDFYLKYRTILRGLPGRLDMLAPETVSNDQAKEYCWLILQVAGVGHNVQVGHSMVFLKEQGNKAMTQAIDRFYGNKAVRIQSCFRRRYLRKKYQKMKVAARVLSRLLLMAPYRRKFLRMRRSAILIQSFFLSRVRRRQFLIAFRRKRAAVLVQSCFRRHRCMQKFIRLRSAVRLQTCFRRYRCVRLYMRALKARVIQTVVRKLLCMRRFRRVVRAVILLQTRMRGSVAKHRFQRQRQAAVRCQSMFRMWKRQTRFHAICFCVLKMQTLFRGAKNRRRYAKLRASALRIQSQFRRAVNYFQYHALRSGVIHCQAVFRGFRLRRQRKIAACTRIQAIARSYITRRTFVRKQIASLVLQNNFRRYRAVKKWQMVRKRIVQIQATWRRNLAERMFMRSYHAIIRLQSFARMIRIRSGFELQSAAARMLQAWYRMISTRFQFIHTMTEIVRLQAVFRKWFYSRRYAQQQFAAVRLQTIIRSFLCVSHYRIQVASLVAIQSTVRRHQAQQRYILKYSANMLIQTAIRRYLVRKEYLGLRCAILFMQRVLRGCQARLKYRVYYNAIVRLQSFGRMLIERYRYHEILVNVIIMQTFLRCRMRHRQYQHTLRAVLRTQTMLRKWRARMHYQQDRRRIIRLQSLGRMWIQRDRYHALLFSVIFIQSIVRRHLNRTRFVRLRNATIKLQAWFRFFPRWYEYQRWITASIIVARCVRRWRQRTAYTRLRCATLLSQRAVRNFLQNFNLRRRMDTLHRFEAPVPSGIVTAVLDELHDYPEDRRIRHYKLKLRTFLQSVVLYPAAASLKLLSTLPFAPSECFETDIQGRCAVHYLAEHPSLLVTKRVSTIVNQFVPPAAEVVEGLDEDDNDNDGPGDTAAATSSASDRVNQIKQAIDNSVRQSKLKEGWLKKKRGGMMWQKRWVILTDEYIIYYKSAATVSNPKFAIPLEGCTVQRVPGSRDPIFEVFAPNMGVKKSLFGSSTKKSVVFLAEHEREMQEWLTPLRAVAGVATLRPGRVSFVQLELRTLWLSQLDQKGETAAHVLIRTAANAAKNATGVAIIEYVKLLAWMLESGCPVNAQNEHGNTVLHVALVLGVDIALVKCLVLKGANPKTLKNRNGKSCLDILNDDADVKKKYGAAFAYGAVASSRSPALSLGFAGKMKGYSYLSLYFGDQVFEKSQATTGEQPMLIVSARNSKHELIEAAQELRGPAWVSAAGGAGSGSAASVYWGLLWHMQTPLENLEEGSHVLVEYRPRADGPVVSAGQIPLDRNTIDSGESGVSLTVPSDGGRQANPIVALNEKSSMLVDVELNRKNRPLSAQHIKDMP